MPREAVVHEAWADSAQELELRHRVAAPGQLLTSKPQKLVCGLPLKHPLAVCSRAVSQVRQTLMHFCRLHIWQVQEQRRQKAQGANGIKDMEINGIKDIERSYLGGGGGGAWDVRRSEG